MPRTLLVAPHLSLEELRQLERSVPSADRLRVLAVRLMAEGRPATIVGPLGGSRPSGSAPWSIGTTRMDPRPWAMVGSGTPGRPHSWMLGSRRRCGPRWAAPRRMAGSGPAAGWRSG